jgi:hypothetical protein
MPQSALLSFSPVANHLGQLQFSVSSLWLTLKRVNTSPSLLARVFRLWILLLTLSFAESETYAKGSRQLD